MDSDLLVGKGRPLRESQRCMDDTICRLQIKSQSKLHMEKASQISHPSIRMNFKPIQNRLFQMIVPIVLNDINCKDMTNKSDT